MILVQKNIFTKEECDSIIWNETENITNWNKMDRKYQSHPIIFNEKTKWIFDKLKYFFENETNIKIRDLKETIHFHKFNVGDWFDIHDDDRDRRLFSVGVLLNEDFGGGDFILYNPNEIILEKKAGNTYLFDAKIKHQITKIENKERYSLIWFLQNENLKIDKKSLL